MTILRVLTEDGDRLADIETEVNANRVAMGLLPLAGGDIISGTIQVGLNALTDRTDMPYTAPNIPELSIEGLPFANDNVAIIQEIEDRISAIAMTLGVTLEDMASLALHAGCLVMMGETENKGYRPSFD